MTLLIIYLLLAIAVSFLCSILEAVILSVSASFIRMKRTEGKSAAKHLSRLKNNIDEPLAAILSINTVAHTVGAAGVGAQAVAVFGEIYFGIISAGLTLAILIFSEIIPKTIGALYWRNLALLSSRIIIAMIYIAYPLVLLSRFITKLISRKKNALTMTRDELIALAHLGSKNGILEETESKIITNLIRLRTIKVNRIMTPRTVVVAAPEDMLLVDFIKEKKNLQHSRIPVYQDSIDQVTGYILNADVLEKLAEETTNSKLIELKRSIQVFYKNFTIPRLFEEFLIKNEQIAVIIDEYGGMEGVVTLEDIIETILGLEIVDEKDTEMNKQDLARKIWQIRKRKLGVD
ncbi:MAG: CNNM domain-containing protein [Melioribacteraceae bacterium]|nr:CNNM domain-containing protein [Melioribacteraceae bacterium]